MSKVKTVWCTPMHRHWWYHGHDKADRYRSAEYGDSSEEGVLSHILRKL